MIAIQYLEASTHSVSNAALTGIQWPILGILSLK